MTGRPGHYANSFIDDGDGELFELFELANAWSFVVRTQPPDPKAREHSLLIRMLSRALDSLWERFDGLGGERFDEFRWPTPRGESEYQRIERGLERVSLLLRGVRR